MGKCHPLAVIACSRRRLTRHRREEAGVFGPLRAQLIFEGKTDACLPSSGADLPGLSCTHTESHWSSQDTLVDAAILIDQAMNPEGEKQDWLLLLDMASTHTGEHFRKRMREEYLGTLLLHPAWIHQCVPAP